MPETNRAPRDDGPAPESRPLSGRHVIVLGPGRVGMSFGHWLLQLGARVTISGRHRSDSVAELLASGAEWRSMEALDGGADVLLLTVSDGAIRQLAGLLTRRPCPSTVLHVSGHLDAEALAELRGAGHATGSIHPLRAFADASHRLQDAAGTTFAVDGDAGALVWARRLAMALGGRPIELDGEERVLYHLAASLAAGGVVTVLAAADRLRHRTGLPPGLMASYLHLTRGAVDQIPADASAVATAITGPAARGDMAVLERQRAAVRKVAPELLPLLDALNELTRGLRDDTP